jgi:predicted DNA-binding ribbon-helix-helix protein
MSELGKIMLTGTGLQQLDDRVARVEQSDAELLRIAKSGYAETGDSRFSSRSHSIRLGGSVTSVRLENAFWDVLSVMSAEKSFTLNQLIAKIHAEMSGLNGPHNTASILRVICIEWASEALKRTKVRRRSPGY